MLNNTFKLTRKVNKSKVKFQLVVAVLIWNKRDSILVQVLKVVISKNVSVRARQLDLQY